MLVKHYVNIQALLLQIDWEKFKILNLGLYMVLYMIVKHYVNIQALLLQIDWEKFKILSLVYESIGRRGKKHMESRMDVQICKPLVVGVVDGERL